MGSNQEKKVTILSEQELTVSPRPGVTKQVVAVTYLAPGLPPRTIWIDKDKYTEDNLKQVIRQDMEQAAKQKQRTITL